MLKPITVDDTLAPRRAAASVREPATGSPRTSLGMSRDGDGPLTPTVHPSRHLRRVVHAGEAGNADAQAAEVAEADYRIDGIIGEGGMGVVYAATQIALDRGVALKRMRSDDAARLQFLSEAVVTGRLDHPNIVPIHDLGIDQHGVPFYTMKKVQGRAWIEVMRSISRDENLDILLKICDAVAFAHAHGVIHRDLKPDNVLLGEFGEVLLVDWGLATSVEDLRSHPSDHVCGTPAYMAPEMAWADARLINTGSDIYLLGAILSEIITGLPPHPGATIKDAIDAAAANRIDPAPPAGELGDIARKAMAMDPQQRFASVRDFQQALRTYRTHAHSERLSDYAATLLRAAQATGSYADFARALYGFEESLSFWNGNVRARKGVHEARIAYAEQACIAGDLDLAESLLGGEGVEQDTVRLRIASARSVRARHRQRLRLLSWLIVGMTFLLLVALAVGTWITVTDYRLVVKASHARDDAEARLMREESQLLHHDRRMWEPILSEDFSTLFSDPAAEATGKDATMQMVGGHWRNDQGVFVATGPGRSLLRLNDMPVDDVRLQFDLAAPGDLSVHMGVAASDVPDHLNDGPLIVVLSDSCRVTADGQMVAESPMPHRPPGLSQRIRIERVGSSLRLFVDGTELIHAHFDIVILAAQSQLVIAADPAVAIDNLRVDRLSRAKDK